MLYLKGLPAEDVIEKFDRLAQQVFGNDQVTCGFDIGFGLVISVTCPPSAILSQKQLVPLIDVVRGKKYILCRTASVRRPDNAVRIEYALADNKVIATIDFATQRQDQGAQILTAIAGQFPVTCYLDIVESEKVSDIEKSALQLRERSVADLREEITRLAGSLVSLAEKDAEKSPNPPGRVGEGLPKEGRRTCR